MAQPLAEDSPTMPQKPAQTGGVIAVRSKQLLVTVPGLLGFSNLVEPDDAFDSLKFKANHHYTDDQVERLGEQIDIHCISAMWPEFLKACEKAQKAEPKGGWVKPTGADWVNAHLKDPKENSRIQLPFIVWSNDAEFKDKEGNLQRKTMRAYAGSGALLNLPALHLGMGSTVQIVVMPGLFISGLIKQPQPSMKLQGVRVITLVQFGSGPGLGALTEEDTAMLGEDLQADDLSAFVGGMTTKEPAKAGRGGRTAKDDFNDLDDDIPF